MTGLLTPGQLLEILEGNRRLTVRTIEACPEHELFHYAPGEPLRPFAAMVKEIIHIEAAYVRGIATGEWVYSPAYDQVSTKEDLLSACAAVRRQTLELWPRVTAERLQHEEADNFFGDHTQRNLDRLVYGLENEIHHRGQAYIYLRLMGLEPPAFYER